MALQLSGTVRDAMAAVVHDKINTLVGVQGAVTLRLYTGTPPAFASAASGTLVAEMTLPGNWMAAGPTGTSVLNGTWQDTGANATGTVTYFRIVTATAPTTHIQGTVTTVGGGGDMELSPSNVITSTSQAITIASFTLTASNS